MIDELTTAFTAFGQKTSDANRRRTVGHSSCTAFYALGHGFHRYRRSGAHEAVIAHFHKSGGQHMLQKAMQKRHDLKGHGAPSVAALFFILEKVASIRNFDDTPKG